MKIAYLMLVHKDPQLLKRAIATLSTEDCAFFIHIDRKANIQEFRSIGGDNIFFSEQRIPVHWAEFSQCEATMELIRQALAGSIDYDYLVFLQGATYPLRGGEYIQRFLEKNRDLGFMNLVKMPAAGYPLSKINTLRYPSDKPVRRLASRALAKLGLAQRDYRKHLGGLDAYSGHACWALSRNACQFIMDFATSNPQVVEYFRNTFVPEESFFHTILGNSPLRSRTRKNLVYADWSTSLGEHPAMLNEGHVKFFKAQEKVWVDDEWGSGEVLFARKFSDENLQLVDRIDEMIRRKEGQHASSLSRVKL
ncbi:MAG TPA: beta-1,6-N-acetylglucosaminyltransferase [Candidatus Acidoferrales bacterium]|nr:beta-1,6-N-acetylglucosaminyltransferase [Candidatus Acidoferrales bacterium]